MFFFNFKKSGNKTVTIVDMTKDSNYLVEACDNFIAFDTETTGLDCEKDRIIEISAILFSNGLEKAKFSTLIKSVDHIPSRATKVNHITDEMILNAPNEKDAITSFVKFIGNGINGSIPLVAHNATRYDMKILKNTLERLGVGGTIKYIDTLYISQQNLPDLENHKQTTIAKFYNLINSNEHRAEDDARICGEIFLRLPKEYKHESLNYSDSIMVSHSLSSHEFKSIYGDNISACIQTIDNLTQEEKETCAYIQRVLINNNIDITNLRYYKNSLGVVDVRCYYDAVKFKISKNKKYVIVDKKYVPSSFEVEECSKKEQRDDLVRMLFNEPKDMLMIGDYIVKEYTKIKDLVSDSYEILSKGYLQEYLEVNILIQDSKVDEIISASVERIENIKQKELEELRLQEEIKLKKELEKQQRELEKKIKAQEAPKRQRRKIVQMDDDGNIIEEFESLQSAIDKTGINSKSIRDAANGKQKHAGGYCWKYVDSVDDCL